MKAPTSERAFEHRVYTATIEFSYFNTDHYYEAQTLNHSDEVVCFKSDIPIRPGATLVIRTKNLHPNGACSGECRGLRSSTLAEVKWCKEILDETESFYSICAQYYPPEY